MIAWKQESRDNNQCPGIGEYLFDAGPAYSPDDQKQEN